MDRLPKSYTSLLLRVHRSLYCLPMWTSHPIRKDLRETGWGKQLPRGQSEEGKFLLFSSKLFPAANPTDRGTRRAIVCGVAVWAGWRDWATSTFTCSEGLRCHIKATGVLEHKSCGRLGCFIAVCPLSESQVSQRLTCSSPQSNQRWAGLTTNVHSG